MKKKIVDFVLSLEDEIVIKGVKLPKKYIFIGILALIIYFTILLINLNFSKNSSSVNSLLYHFDNNIISLRYLFIIIILLLLYSL